MNWEIISNNYDEKVTKDEFIEVNKIIKSVGENETKKDLENIPNTISPPNTISKKKTEKVVDLKNRKDMLKFFLKRKSGYRHIYFHNSNIIYSKN